MNSVWLLAVALLCGAPARATPVPDPRKTNCHHLVAQAQSTHPEPWTEKAIVVQADSPDLEFSEFVVVAPQGASTESAPVESKAQILALADKYLHPESHFEKTIVTLPLPTNHVIAMAGNSQNAVIIRYLGKYGYVVDRHAKQGRQFKNSNYTFLGVPFRRAVAEALDDGTFLVSLEAEDVSLGKSEIWRLSSSKDPRQEPLDHNLQKYFVATGAHEGKSEIYYFKPGEMSLTILKVTDQSFEISSRLFSAVVSSENQSVSFKRFDERFKSRSRMIYASQRRELHLISDDFRSLATIEIDTGQIRLRESLPFFPPVNPDPGGASPDGTWIFGMKSSGTETNLWAVNTVDVSKSWHRQISAPSTINHLLVIEDARLVLIATAEHGLVLYDLVYGISLAQRLWDSPPFVTRIKSAQGGGFLFRGPKFSEGRNRKKIEETLFVLVSPLDGPLSLTSPAWALESPAVLDAGARLHQDAITLSQEFNQIESTITDPQIWNRLAEQVFGNSDAPSFLENLRVAIQTLQTGKGLLLRLKEKIIGLQAALEIELEQNLDDQVADLRRLDPPGIDEAVAQELKHGAELRSNTVSSLEKNLQLIKQVSEGINLSLTTSSKGALALENLQRKISANENYIEDPSLGERLSEITKALRKVPR